MRGGRIYADGDDNTRERERGGSFRWLEQFARVAAAAVDWVVSTSANEKKNQANAGKRRKTTAVPLIHPKQTKRIVRRAGGVWGFCWERREHGKHGSPASWPGLWVYHGENIELEDTPRTSRSKNVHWTPNKNMEQAQTTPGNVAHTSVATPPAFE